MRVMQKFTLKDGYMSQLRCSIFVTGAADTFYFTPALNAHRIFDQLDHLPSDQKKLWIGKGVETGGLPAKISSMVLMHQKMFAWLDEQFGKS